MVRYWLVFQGLSRDNMGCHHSHERLSYFQRCRQNEDTLGSAVCWVAGKGRGLYAFESTVIPYAAVVLIPSADEVSKGHQGKGSGMPFDFAYTFVVEDVLRTPTSLSFDCCPVVKDFNILERRNLDNEL